VSLGDVAGIPTGKTSAAIRKQVPIAVRNLVATLEGKAPEAKHDGYAACPIVTDCGHVPLCEFDYDKKPKSSFPFSRDEQGGAGRARVRLHFFERDAPRARRYAKKLQF